MSHFTTLVTIEKFDGDNQNFRDRVDEVMAPYMENCCGEPERKYMEFYDMEEEVRKQFETLTDKKEYPTFESYIEKYHGYSKDSVTGKYGYWQNPNAKWDWYEIGGRWSGFFWLKPGCIGFQGKQYNLGDEYKKSRRADICLKGDVDVDGMRGEAETKARLSWETVRKVIGGNWAFKTWDEVKEQFDLDPNKENKQIEEARKFYWAQPSVKKFREYGMSEEGRKNELVNFFEGPDEYRVPVSEYVQLARNHAIVTFAFVKDGKWAEQGKMGGFAVVHDEKDPETWNSIYTKMFDSLPDDILLCLVDCHI